MSFTTLDGYSKLIANLSDSPSETMSAMELKQYWDSSPEEARQAINRLIHELETLGAAYIGGAAVTGLHGTTVREVLRSLKDLIDTHSRDVNNPHGVTAAQLNVYTKDELIPFLSGGDTAIVEEVFIVVSNNNGDGTFTYQDADGNRLRGQLTEEGYQVFKFENGRYELGSNRVECIVNDTLRRSVRSGGLKEISSDEVALTVPEVNGAEITFKYFQRIGITGEYNVSVGENQPPKADNNTLWFKVIS